MGNSKSKVPHIGIILFTVFIDMVGFGIVIPVLPIYAEELGATAIQVGMLVAVYSACQFLFAPWIGKISDRVGRRPVLIVSIFGTAVGFFVLGWGGAIWILFLGRIIDGISGGNIGVAQAYIADITPPEHRSRSMGMIGAVIGMGFIFGPFIGGLMSTISPGAPFYFAGCLALINAVLVIIILPESLDASLRSHLKPKKKLLQVFEHSQGSLYGRVLAGYFLAICGFAMLTTVWALFLKHQFGYSEKEAGYLFAFVGVIGVIMQGGVLRRLLRSGKGEKALAFTGAVILAVSCAGMPLTASLATLLLASAGLAIGNSLVNPILNGLASRSVDSDWQGRALGLLQSSGSLGRTIGPVAAGILLAAGGAPGSGQYAWLPLFASAGVVMLSALVILTFPKPKHHGLTDPAKSEAEA